MESTRSARKSTSPIAAAFGSASASASASGNRQLQLPPLTSASSDNEREAHIRNRHEQIRLNKLLDHIDVQERVFVQLFNKERHVIETTMTSPVPSSSSSSTAVRCRHHRDTHRSQQQRQQQQQMRLRWAASGAIGNLAGGGPGSGTAAVVAERGGFGRSQSHSSPTLASLVDNGEFLTGFEFGEGVGYSSGLLATHETSTQVERRSSLKVVGSSDLPRSFSMPETKCLACDISPATLHRHDERNADNYNDCDVDKDADDDDVCGQTLSVSHAGVADPSAVVLLPAVTSGRHFVIGDSRSSSLDSDDVCSMRASELPLQRQHHEGPHLFRSMVGRPASAADCMRCLRRQSRVDVDDQVHSDTHTSRDEYKAVEEKSSGTTASRLLGRQRYDDTVPTIVVNFKPIGNEENDDTPMSTIRRIGDNLGTGEVVQEQITAQLQLQVNTEKKREQPAICETNEELPTDRRQLRSVSATQLTSVFVSDMTSFPPIDQQSDEEDAAQGATSKRTAKKNNISSVRNTNNGSCTGLPTTNNNESRTHNVSTSTTMVAERKHAELPKPVGEKRSANLWLTAASTARRTSIVDRELPSELADRSTKKAPVESGSKQLGTLTSKAIGPSAEKSTTWRDTKIRRASTTAVMSSGMSDDPEMKLRKELRLLERQRRIHEEQAVARRVDRARAIASERSKYGSGLAPRLEQFFSRILWTQQPPKKDQRELEKDNVDECDDRERKSGKCAPAITDESRLSPVSSVDSDDYSHPSWGPDDDPDCPVPVAVQRHDTTEHIRLLDGNNNRHGCFVKQ